MQRVPAASPKALCHDADGEGTPTTSKSTVSSLGSEQGPSTKDGFPQLLPSAAPVSGLQTARSGCGGCFSLLLGISPRKHVQDKGGFSAILRRKRSTSSSLYTLDQFEHVGLLGCGAFGAVTLVKCKVTSRTLAMKAVSKGLIVQRRMQLPVLREKEIMKKSAGNPFVVKLVATLVDDERLYFLMEPAMGGDLGTVYIRYPLFGSEAYARFYTACIFRALEHLHESKVVYRDVKMENVVVDRNGYGKLCDFGMATCLTEQNDRAYTICGTPGYMAPEVASGSGYAYAADWWSLGILLYELMVGELPFISPDPADMAAKRSFDITAVPMPEGAVWADLVRSICKQAPGERLPMLAGGSRALQAHPWYSSAGFDWASHATQEMVASHLPVVDGPEDLSNFGASWFDRPRSMFYVDPGTGWDDNFEEDA